MKVTLIQMDILWKDIDKNIQKAALLIREAEKSDLYVLPEMFSTGFATDPVDIAEPEKDGTALQWMKSMAKETDAAIAGSVAVRGREGKSYNRFYFVKPDGSVCHYDKRHLFSYGGEDRLYTSGKDRCIVEWRGVRFMLQVCYDLRFPVYSRNKVPYYDCCLYVASWPESRRRVWDVLLQARALENQCYVLGINRVGNDPMCHYNGGTQAVDAYGRSFSIASDNKEQSVTVNIDMDKLLAFRKKFPVLKDADTI